jgi:hypothetical protein
MTASPRRDLAGAEFSDADMHGARFHMVDLRESSFRLADLSRSRLRGVYLVDAEIDGEIEGLRIHGVDVAPLVQAELDRRHPERAALHAREPGELRAGWAGLQEMWAGTLARVAGMPAPTPDVAVDGEWSVAQTLRHLLLATDAWLGAAILGRERPFHPLGVLFSEYAGREADYGLDADATPTFAEVLAARAGRAAMVHDYLSAVTAEELAGTRTDPWGSGWQPTVLECLQVIFAEEWNHHRYVVRDLATIAGGS